VAGASPGSREVVCLHGLGRTPADWDGVAPGLAWFGEVRTPTLPRVPGAALEIAAAAVPPGAIVVGHSIGGVLALRMQAREARPLTALVLTDAFFPPARNGRGTIASVRDYGRHRVAYVRGVRDRAGAPSVGTPRSGNLGALAGLVRLALRRREFDAAAAAVGAPVLVVHARDDHHVPIDFAAAAVARRPGWRLAVLPRGGHHAHVTEPTLWLDAVTPFLETSTSMSGELLEAGMDGYDGLVAEDLNTRLDDLDKGLAEFDASQTAPASVGKVFNALLGQARQDHPGDAVLEAVEPVAFTSEQSEFAEINVGALRTLIQQIRDAIA
jgi:pimeloyl-[acyl-carrier protein] methyl ester esterase